MRDVGKVKRMILVVIGGKFSEGIDVTLKDGETLTLTPTRNFHISKLDINYMAGTGPLSLDCMPLRKRGQTHGVFEEWKGV